MKILNITNKILIYLFYNIKISMKSYFFIDFWYIFKNINNESRG